jgi:metallo-beta-lactamase family protein
MGNRIVRTLVDIGSYQGDEQSDRGGFLPKGITAAMIDVVIITHAHIDHSGMMPKLIKDGFKGFVYTHPATRDLLEILLADSGNIQTQEARIETKRLRRRGYKGPDIKPLYTKNEALSSLQRVRTIEYNAPTKVAPELTVIFKEAQHLLGAATVTLIAGSGENQRIVVDNGNIGRPSTSLLRPLQRVRRADLLLVESTYGNVLHDKRDRLQALADIINPAYKRALKKDPKYLCGKILIPSFSVGRTQAVLNDLRQLMEQRRIPVIPVFVDGKMVNRATAVYRKYPHLYDDKTRALFAQGKDPFTTPKFMECTNRTHHNTLREPAAKPVIIIGSAGMANAGRIRNHIKDCLPGRQHTILFVGHQEDGTLGYDLTALHPKSVRIERDIVRCNATIELMMDYSAHADYEDSIAWMSRFEEPPKLTVLKHGEPEALEAFKKHIEEKLPGWKVVIARQGEAFDVN